MQSQTLFKNSFPGTKVKMPGWFPENLREEVKRDGSFTHSFKFGIGERKVYRREKPIRPSDWAAKNRVLTMSSRPGRWKNENAPYLVGIMDAIDFPSVREIATLKGPQAGVSEGTHNFIGYALDRKPGPVLYVYPDQTTAKENSNDRILPMIKSSPRLRSYLTGAQDDEASYRINLSHVPIYLAWGSSTSRLSNKPIHYAVADEIDKAGFDCGKSKETSPLNLIRKRLLTYNKRSKLIKISTPTVEAGNIWVEFQNSQAKFDFVAVCPECEARQVMKFEQIKWDGGKKADPDHVADNKTARYQCRACKSMWTDQAREVAVRSGFWQERTSGLELFAHLKSFRPVRIGFHLPSWLSAFVSLSDVAASFLRGQKDVEELKDFFNSHMALPYIPKRKERRVDALAKLKTTYPEAIVPGGNVVAGMVAGVDTQDDGFWYEIRAFGWGKTKKSWQIRHGFEPTFEGLEQVLWGDKYRDVNGLEYHLSLAVMDAMGHRTTEVYEFCADYRGFIYPFQGKQTMPQPWRLSAQEFYPGTGKQRVIPGGLQLLQGNVTYYKNELNRLMGQPSTSPSAWLYHSETTDAWLEMQTWEYLDEKGFWQCPPGKHNHGWDCSVYALIAHDVTGMKHWEPEIEDEPGQIPEENNTAQHQKRSRKRW